MLTANKIIFEVIFLICTSNYVAYILCVDNVISDNKTNPFIYKCCELTEILDITENGTVYCNNLYYGFPNNTYIFDVNIKNTSKTIPDVFQIKMFDQDLYNTENLDHGVYILENGKVVVEVDYPNSFTRWTYIERDAYCFDYILDEDSLQLTVQRLRNNEGTEDIKIYINSLGFVISSFFLALVLAVYAMFPELRTLGGKVAMTCAASLFGAYSLQASFNFVMYYSSVTQLCCVALPTLIYFFFIATFFWMNVMSYDLWWTFRGIAKSRKINRRGEAFKYCMYSIYGWGMPLSLTIFMVLMNEHPPPGSISPSIGVFQCYLGDKEQGLYMYVPMFILLMCNCILFLMTVFNIWRSNKSVNMLRSKSSAATKNSRNMFYVFLKISVIMGISFVLEIVSYLTPTIKFWYITDAYNILIGVSFFVIFVCKRRVFRLISRKFNGEQVQFSSVSTTPTERK